MVPYQRGHQHLRCPLPEIPPRAEASHLLHRSTTVRNSGRAGDRSLTLAHQNLHLLLSHPYKELRCSDLKVFPALYPLISDMESVRASAQNELSLQAPQEIAA
jgi:hypothetical protein